MGMNPSSHLAAECDAHVVGSGTALAALRNFKAHPVISAEWDWTSQGIVSVVSDHAMIGKMAAEHFLQRGIKNFAGFGFSAPPFWVERLAAFRKAVELAGGVYWQGGDHYLTSAETAANINDLSSPNVLKWLSSLPVPIGIFTGVDAWGRMLLPCVLQSSLQSSTGSRRDRSGQR